MGELWYREAKSALRSTKAVSSKAGTEAQVCLRARGPCGLDGVERLGLLRRTKWEKQPEVKLEDPDKCLNSEMEMAPGEQPSS